MFQYIPSILGLFNGAQVFNGDVSKWDTSKVTNMSCKSKSCEETNVIMLLYLMHAFMMSYSIHYIDMFSAAYNFTGDVSTWDTIEVTDMYSKSKRCLFSMIEVSICSYISCMLS